MKPADKTLLTSSAIVALSTAVLSSVTGYGTILFQIVVLGAWSIVARLSSGQFADLHRGPVWLVALVLNLIGFLIVAAPVWAIYRNRSPKIASTVTICWLALYVAMLFFLFPATDGP